ncbi:MAG: dTDP-4-dehydrorhamnose reductase [bacterium]|nr:dTDP-4-dehydrorhamnose reductase [bacterium]
MLGAAVMDVLGREHQVRGVDLPDGDLGEAGVAARLIAPEIEWVVHCAAWTDVDGAESHLDEALAANAGATAHVAAACAGRGAGLTYVSTDYIFDGRGDDGGYDEDAPRDPLNHYGLTKARGEEAVEVLDTPWQIVRTAWLFGDGRVNFVKTIRRLLGERETLQVVDDQRGCPTYAPDLAEVIGFLVTRRGHGIFHGTNAGECTWHGFAQEVARRVGTDPERVRPCGSDAFPTVAARPACSVLRSWRLEEAGCPPRPHWRDAVARYLELLESGAARHP